MIHEIESRRSIRKYLNKPVDDEQIMEILRSAHIAPSGSNTQPWHFIIIKSDEMREKLAKASHNQSWMTTAPVYIACVGDVRSRINDGTELILDENSPQEELKQVIRDTAIAVDHLTLAAENLGLGTCWVAWYTQDVIRPILNVPTDKYVLSIITIGYADESPTPRPRKNLDSIIHNETW